LTLAVVTLALCAPIARSQTTFPMVAEEGALHVMLLRQKCIRDELKLTDDEARAIKTHNNRQYKRALAIHKMPRDQQDAQYQMLTRENEQFLDRVLEPSQRKRLDEITLHVAGLLMATSPKVAAQLNLTADQKAQLLRHQQTARHELTRALESKSQEERERKIQELQKTSRKNLEDVLTDVQEAKWKAMAGEKFEGKFEYDSENQ
jgi:hypothetical protein